MTDLIQPVILSGGAGTRLWPASREQFPKQLLPLAMEDTLLQATVRRLQGFSGADVMAPLVVVNEAHRFMAAEQLRSVGQRGARLILEPEGRNTAPALTLAALVAVAEGADPLLLVMPADHVVREASAFQRALACGLGAAAAGGIVTFGVVPDRPETGYGYIQATTRAGAGEAVLRITRFVEKPDAATAASYLADGGYLWNSGIFLMRASLWLDTIDTLQPAIASACAAAVADARQDAEFLWVARDAFVSCPADSIDYAVMEPLSEDGDTVLPPALVVPLDAGWSDVGSWDSLWATAAKDAANNVIRGDVILDATRNSLVHAQHRLVACVGVEDMVVVETADAVLVARMDQSQAVKQLVARLRDDERHETEVHRKVHRPWGYFDAIDAGKRFQVKRIVVSPGASLSLQMHHHRAEHWIVVCGTARVTCGDRTFLLGENQSTYIPCGTTHRLENPGKLPLEIIEVQSGAYLGEDDIVRFDDPYGRATE